MPVNSQVESVIIFVRKGRNQVLRFELSELDRHQRAEARVPAAVVVIVKLGFDGAPRFNPGSGIHAR
jgi:hypothetical protein